MKNKAKSYSLDEMQEQKLLKLEEKGFWLLFWLLFTAIVVQFLIKPDIKMIAGEAIILIIAGFYLAICSVGNGIWSKGIAPSVRINLLISIIPALLFGVILCIRAFVINKAPLSFETVTPILVFTVLIYAVGFILLEILRKCYQRKRDALDNENQ